MYGIFVCVSYGSVHFRLAFVLMDGTVGVYAEKQRLWRSKVYVTDNLMQQLSNGRALPTMICVYNYLTLNAKH